MDAANITHLLQAHASGNEDALEKLIPLLYEELRIRAHRRLQNERSHHTLNTIALVHEAFLKLEQFDRINWKNRSHFLAIASQVMRNILVDYAVKKKAEKRGGERQRVTLGEAHAAVEMKISELLTIHQALERLTSADERKARVVECRFFGGMTIKETSKALGISVRTVNRDWDVASAWLKNELEK